MNKRIISLLLALFACMFMFFGCALVDYPAEEGKKEPEKLVLVDDFLVGMLIYVANWQDDELVCYPSDNLDDENAIYLYQKEIEADGFNYYSLMASDYLFDVFTGMTNSGTNVNEQTTFGRLEVSATFAYTYELFGNVLYVDDVYKKNDKFEYFTTGSGIGMGLNEFGKGSLSSNQTLTAFKTINGQKTEIKYEGEWTLSIEFVNYLVGAKVLEFNSNHDVINEGEIDLNAEDFVVHSTIEGCEYVIIEEEYEVMHDDYRYPKGTRYIERYFVDKSELNKYHFFKIPLGNGFVKQLGLEIISYDSGDAIE